MPYVPISFCGQSYVDRSPNANAQECINLYPMKSPSPEDPNRIVMYPTPGYSLYCDTVAQGIAQAGAIRACIVVNGSLYAVAGGAFVSIDFGGRASPLGMLLTPIGVCSLACNTVEIAISDGSFGYVYNLGTRAFTVISGGSWPSSGGVTNLAFIDDYVIAAVNGSRQVIQSELLAAGVYDAQAFVNVASFPDNLVGVFSDQLQLYLFGPFQTEVRFDSGQIPFAFEKVQGVLIQAGLVAWPTLVRAGSTIIWLAQDTAGKYYVASLQGYNPQVLSTPPMNEAMERYGTVSDAFAYTYREGDNQFYMITFPTEGVTWGIELKTGMVHKRSVGDGADMPLAYAYFNGNHIVGDSSGKLYQMSQDFQSDGNGNGLKRVRTCQHLAAGGMPIFMHELQIDIESGVGLLNGQGQNPLATMEVSRDSGNTWTNIGAGSMGLMGQYKARLIWRRLGRALDTMTFRLTITDPVRTYIMGAMARITVGNK